MSFTERKTGRARLIAEMTEEEANRYCRESYEVAFGPTDELPCYCDNWIEAYNDKAGDKEMFLYIKGVLWLLLDINTEDTGESFCKLIPNDDGTYSFITQYYNGGTCLSEMMTDALGEL